MAKIEDTIPFEPGPDCRCQWCCGSGTIEDTECCDIPDADSEGNLHCCGQPLRHEYECTCVARRALAHRQYLEEVEKELEEVLLGKPKI